MRQVKPIFVAHLFPPLQAKLMELLQSLSDADWQTPALPAWTVKDIAAHLLDGDLRRLSMARDGFWGERFRGGNYEDLVGYLNGLNADWVKAFRRVSPRVLTELLGQTGEPFAELMQKLDPFQPALFSVAWAGEEQSLNWFDVAREYTEKWHHQQQIRVAVNKPGIMSRELYFPVLDTFMRVLPFAYRAVSADEGDSLKIHVGGAAGGTWFLCRNEQRWVLCRESAGQVRAEVVIPQEIAWRLFTRGVDKKGAQQQLQIAGDTALAGHITDALAVMA